MNKVPFSIATNRNLNFFSKLPRYDKRFSISIVLPTIISMNKILCYVCFVWSSQKHHIILMIPEQIYWIVKLKRMLKQMRNDNVYKKKMIRLRANAQSIFCALNSFSTISNIRLIFALNYIIDQKDSQRIDNAEKWILCTYTMSVCTSCMIAEFVHSDVPVDKWNPFASFVQFRCIISVVSYRTNPNFEVIWMPKASKHWILTFLMRELLQNSIERLLDMENSGFSMWKCKIVADWKCT